MPAKAIITIFGASGDLAKRKLYPALFRLFKTGKLADNFAVIGASRRPWSKEEYEAVVLESIQDLVTEPRQAQDFATRFYYQSHDVTSTLDYRNIRELQNQLNDRYQADNNKLFFLSMSPHFFGTIAKHLKSENIIDGLGFEHLIIEKPFGSDLESACQLNEELMESFREDQIFRIDHYLGKEMVENIYAIRFANPIIDRIWDRHSIHNIQITLAEQLGVEERGDYYDQSGALRDMVQNHALQILSLLTMDKPHSFSKHDIRAEKVKVFQSLKKPGPKELANHFIRGQYTASQDLPGYREEPKVNPDSMTETYFAGVFFLDSDRFRNVPIFIRTGKRLSEKATRVDIVFKQEETIFAEDLAPNILTLYIQPEEGISFQFNQKIPGYDFTIQPQAIWSFDRPEGPEGYEKLILEALQSNSSNFSHWHEVKASWKLIDKIEHSWQEDQSPLHFYPAGSHGPEAADQLLAQFDAKWIW